MILTLQFSENVQGSRKNLYTSMKHKVEIYNIRNKKREYYGIVLKYQSIGHIILLLHTSLKYQFTS